MNKTSSFVVLNILSWKILWNLVHRGCLNKFYQSTTKPLRWLRSQVCRQLLTTARKGFHRRVILSRIGLMATGSMLILVLAWSVCILLECFLVSNCRKTWFLKSSNLIWITLHFLFLLTILKNCCCILTRFCMFSVEFEEFQVSEPKSNLRAKFQMETENN